MAHPARARRIARVGPVVEQRPEVDQRLTQRRHVPVEDRLDAVGVGRVELAVVELQVVVHDRHPGRRGQRRLQAQGQLVHDRGTVVGTHQVPPGPPAGHLAGREALGLAQVGHAGRRRVEQVQLGHGVDEGEAHPAVDVGVVGHGRRHAVAHDLAAATLHHHEVRADDLVVVAEQERPGRPVERAPEPRQHAVLAAHVVRARRHHPERRSPQHQLRRTEAQEVGEVGRAVRELLDLHRPVEALDAGAHVGLEGRPVELLTRPDRSQLGCLDRSRSTGVAGRTGHSSARWCSMRSP